MRRIVGGVVLIATGLALVLSYYGVTQPDRFAAWGKPVWIVAAILVIAGILTILCVPFGGLRRALFRDVRMGGTQADGLVLVQVTNNGPASDFSAEITSLAPDGVHIEPGVPLPYELRWTESRSPTIQIMPGQTRHVQVGRYDLGGLAHVRNGHWHLEPPPFVLRETPTPTGGGVNYVGIYPPLGLRTPVDTYRFSMVVTASSSTRRCQHKLSLGFQPNEPVRDE